MGKKSVKKKTEKEVPERKGTLKLLDEIISESLSSDANLIIIEGKIRELEDSERNYVPLLLKRATQGKTKEQKVILDLLVRKKNREVIGGVHYIAKEPLASIRIRCQALGQLRKWGESADETFQKDLEEAEEVISTVEKHAAFGGPLELEVERSVTERFHRLPKDLKNAVIRELLHEYAHGLPVALKLARGEEDLDERIVMLLADRETEEVADFFCRLMAETTNNKLRRLIKKALFQMKNKGLEVTIPSVEEGKVSTFPKIETTQAHAYVTSIDYLGDRLIFLSKSVFGWGMVFFQMTMSDQEGIKSLSAFNLNRRETKNFLDRVSKDGIIQLVDIPPEYCHFLIDEAYRVNIKKGISPPEQFNYWKVEMDELKGEVSQAIIYAHLSPETLQKEKADHWREQYHTIIELDFFKDWFLEPRFVWEYVEKVNAIATSPLVLNPYQVEERKESIIAGAIERIFSDELREVYKRRLEEMAYIIFRRKAEDSARLVLFAARDLEKGGIPPAQHGFLKGLVRKSILLYLHDANEAQKDKLIIRPR